MRHFSICMDLELDTFLHNSCFYNKYEFQELLKTKKYPKKQHQNPPSAPKKTQNKQTKIKTKQTKNRQKKTPTTKNPKQKTNKKPHMTMPKHSLTKVAFVNDQTIAFKLLFPVSHLNASKHQHKGVSHCPRLTIDWRRYYFSDSIVFFLRGT